jgi:flagellar hook assembly protein FlgD
MIRYDFPHPGAMATILVMDPRGRVIKTIAENQLLGSEGFFTWDGINDYGQKARTGLYMVYVRIFDAKGKVRNYKKTCVLSPGTRH